MGRRSKNEIIQEILQEATDWKSKTYVYYRTNTNYNLFRKYYNALIKVGYLGERESKNPTAKYECKTTQEGLELLNALKKTSLRLETVKKLI